jgi:hypothetical protein
MQKLEVVAEDFFSRLTGLQVKVPQKSRNWDQVL